MTFNKVLMLLVAALFILPVSLFSADDFDDDFGGFDDFEEDKKDDGADEFDAEDSAAKKKEKDQEASDAAMKDLLGDEDESPKKKDTKEESKYESKKNEPKKEKKAKIPVEKGFKPVLLIKGGFTPFGQYNTGPKTTLNSMFGSVDEGLLGAEFIGDHVIAKGTLNVRTLNPLLTKGNNPLAKANLHAIQDGFYNGLYEIYGGLKFYDIFIKAGKMIPEYGLMDTYQNLGMGFTTPFLTRSLIAVEGFIPETDAGISLGYKGTFADAHTVIVGLTLGTGSIANEWWGTDKVMGLYGRLGYMHEFFQVALGFQYKQDYYNKTGQPAKKLADIGFGVHMNVTPKFGSHEILVPISFDYNQFQMVKIGTSTIAKKANNILLSVAPGYAYCFDSEWADKIALAVRFDLVRGVYKAGAANYLDYDKFSLSGMVVRLGVTANFFAKDIKGVHSFAGITFLVQPESKIVGKTAAHPSEKDYGFMTLMLSAGAEM